MLRRPTVYPVSRGARNGLSRSTTSVALPRSLELWGKSLALFGTLTVPKLLLVAPLCVSRIFATTLRVVAIQNVIWIIHPTTILGMLLTKRLGVTKSNLLLLHLGIRPLCRRLQSKHVFHFFPLSWVFSLVFSHFFLIEGLGILLLPFLNLIRGHLSLLPPVLFLLLSVVSHRNQPRRSVNAWQPLPRL